MVDADLSKYFDTIPHHELMRAIARRIVDADMLGLIKQWLKAPVETTGADGGTRMAGGKASKMGVPQGGAISPLVANLYMNRFLKYWRQTGSFRHAFCPKLARMRLDQAISQLTLRVNG